MTVVIRLRFQERIFLLAKYKIIKIIAKLQNTKLQTLFNFFNY